MNLNFSKRLLLIVTTILESHSDATSRLEGSSITNKATNHRTSVDQPARTRPSKRCSSQPLVGLGLEGITDSAAAGGVGDSTHKDPTMSARTTLSTTARSNLNRIRCQSPQAPYSHLGSPAAAIEEHSPTHCSIGLAEKARRQICSLNALRNARQYSLGNGMTLFPVGFPSTCSSSPFQ